MSTDLSAEQVEGDGNERHPGGGEKRQDALDSRRHEGAAASKSRPRIMRTGV